MAAEMRKLRGKIETKWGNLDFTTRLVMGVNVILVFILLGGFWFSSETDNHAYVINLYTTFLGAALAVFVIDQLNRRRDDRRGIKDLQEQLVRDAKSIVNDVANNAIHQLRMRGWLEGENGILEGANLIVANLKGANLMGASLEGAYLMYANLEGAELWGASLEGAELRGANLEGANLTVAHLEGANLIVANLKGANLMGASLEGAHLMYANLEGANLWGASLEGAELRGANLKGANLISANLEGAKMNRRWPAEMNEETILPDGSHWTPETDLTKFGVIFEDDGDED